MDRSTPTRARVLIAWGIHAFTASGAVLALWALVALLQGDLATASLCMLAALFIDSADGTLARAFRVSEVLPEIDGRRLDDIVDFLNYAIVPVVFLLAAGKLTAWHWGALPVLASAYGFAQAEAKTEDDFFLGFPSYWNVLALYLWLLDLSPVLSTLLVCGLSIAVFVPLKYVYPSKLKRLKKTTLVASLLWIACVVAAILFPQTLRPYHVVEWSVVYPIYYLGISAWLGRWFRSERALYNPPS